MLNCILRSVQKEFMQAKDARMKKTSEIFTGIKYIKMCGLEDKFLDGVSLLFIVLRKI